MPLDLKMGAVLIDPATRVVICCGAGGVGKTTTAINVGTALAEFRRVTKRGGRLVTCGATSGASPAKLAATAFGPTSSRVTPRRRARRRSRSASAAAKPGVGRELISTTPARSAAGACAHSRSSQRSNSWSSSPSWARPSSPPCMAWRGRRSAC